MWFICHGGILQFAFTYFFIKFTERDKESTALDTLPKEMANMKEKLDDMETSQQKKCSVRTFQQFFIVL